MTKLKYLYGEDGSTPSELRYRPVLWYDDSMTQLIILRGYPGSGKTTIGKHLEADQLGRFIDHNAILTFLANFTGDDEGIYDEIAALELAMCQKLLREEKNVIVARGFSSLSNLAPYEAMISALDVTTTILRLDVGKDALIARVQSPERQLDFNPTTDEAHAIDWMIHHPLENHPQEFIIDNERPVHEVLAHIKTLLASI
jgi:shikimate kinase